MRLLADEALYRDTAACLEHLRSLRPAGPASRPEPVHLYWRGPFGRKQAFAVRSLLATQDLGRAEPRLWLDAEDGYEGHDASPHLAPLLPFLDVRRLAPADEARDTPLEGRSDLWDGVGTAARSDAARFLILHRHGGTYADLDTMFLRDLGPILDDPALGELCYRWSAGLPYGNSAVLRLRRGGGTALALLERCAELGTCLPQRVLRFADCPHVDLVVLPAPYFDPLWPHVDGADRYEAAPFDRFEHFFRPFRPWFPRRPVAASYRDFFPGAFAYHWHGRWSRPERERSYFGRFERELDAVLAERLGVEAAGRPVDPPA